MVLLPAALPLAWCRALHIYYDDTESTTRREEEDTKSTDRGNEHLQQRCAEGIATRERLRSRVATRRR